MILYSATNYYQLLNVFVHKMVFHQDDKCILVVSEWIDKNKLSSEICLSFYKIITIKCEGENYKYIEDLSKECKEEFNRIEIKIEDFQDIYIGGVQHKFGCCLIYMGISFSMFEEGSGIISRPERLEEIDKNFSIINMEYCKKLGIYDGSNPLIKKIFCNFKAQIENYYNEKATDFDVIKYFINLSTVNQNQIKNFYTEINKIEIQKGSVLLLTQSFANLKILSFEEQVLIYQTLIDYFFYNYFIIIKPHPDDLLYYNELFVNCFTIKEKFPSEFLPVMFSNQPEIIATISSSAINNLKNYFENSFFLDTRYEKDFYATHRYYAALKLFKKVSLKNSQIATIGANEKLIKNLLCTNEFELKETVIESNNKTENVNRFYIIDDIETQGEFDRNAIITLTENLPDNSSIVFINFKQDFCFYDINHKALWKYIVPICIGKKQNRDDEFYADINQEMIYFYSKNERILNMANNFEFERELTNTGMTVSVEKMTAEQKRIKVLEGILEATEKRLLYYIELVDREKNK